MILKPLSPRPPRPVAVISRVDRGRIGVEAPEGLGTLADPATVLPRLADHAIYSVLPWDVLTQAGDRRWWSVRVWNGVAVKANWHGGVSRPIAIYLLPRKVTREQVWGFAALATDTGLRASGLTAFAASTLRASLARPVHVAEGTGRSGGLGVGHQALHGGRKEARPGHYTAMHMIDLEAAYPTAMAAEPIATGLREVPVRNASSTADGIAEAVVEVPAGLAWGPLPKVLTDNLDCYGWGCWHGFFTLRELRLARELGCDVGLLRVWESRKLSQMFAVWAQEWLEPLRALGHIGKVVANRLWSTFAITDGTAETLTWDAEGRMLHHVDKAVTPAQRAWRESSVFVATEIVARVRERLFREGLGPATVFCDTDGVIVPADSPVPAGWRVKTPMSTVWVKAAHAYAWRERAAGPVSYRVAGARTREQCRSAWQAGADIFSLASPFPAALPPQDVSDL